MVPCLSASRSLKVVRRVWSSDEPSMSVSLVLSDIIIIMQEFQRQLSKQRQLKIAELMGLEQRRLGEYKSLLSKLQNEKSKLINEKSILESKILQIIQRQKITEEKHEQQIQKLRQKLQWVQEQQKGTLFDKTQKQGEIVKLNGNIAMLRKQIQLKKCQIADKQQAWNSTTQQFKQEILKLNDILKLEKTKQQQTILQLKNKHQQQLNSQQKIIRLQLDSKLKQLDKNKASSSSEKDERIKFLENQNLKFVQQMNLRQTEITTLKQKNLATDQELNSQRLKSKLKIKEKQFQIQTLRKQLSFEKQQSKSDNSKYEELLQEKQQTKMYIQEIKRKSKQQIKQNKDLLQRKVKEYIEYTESLGRKHQEEIKELKRSKQELCEQLRKKQLTYDKNILKIQTQMSDKKNQLEEEIKQGRKKQNQLRLQLQSRTNERDRLQQQIQKQRIKIANAMKVFDQLVQSKVDIDKQNKLMVSEIRYWRDKYKEIQKQKQATIRKEHAPPLQPKIREKERQRQKQKEKDEESENIIQKQKSQSRSVKQQKHSQRNEQERIQKPAASVQLASPSSQHPLIKISSILSDKSEQLQQQDELQDVLDNIRDNYDDMQFSKKKSKNRQSFLPSSGHHQKVEVSGSFPRSSQIQSMYRFMQNI